MRINTCVLGLIATLLASPSADARGPIELEYVRPAVKVLGLFDSTDTSKRHKAEILEKRVRGSLRAIKLGLDVRDVNEALPSETEMAQYRGIVTAFSDEGMPNPHIYLRWLHQQLLAGRRVVVLDNLGAYKDNQTEKWVEWSQINAVFHLLGVAYDAKWTDKVELLKIAEQNADIFKGGKAPDPANTRHYYRFRPIGDIDAHLVIDRTDLEQGQSAVVFTSERGGMALTRYYESDSGAEHLKLRPFLTKALYPQGTHSSRVLFLVDPDTGAGHSMETNLYWIVRYSRLQADFMHMRDLAALRRLDLRRYGTVVLASYDNGLIDETAPIIRGIERWVHEDGGGLVALFPVRVPGWDKLFGIKKFRESTTLVKGIRYAGGFFPGVEGLHVRGTGYGGDEGVEVNNTTITDDAVVLAGAVVEGEPTKLGQPVLWKRTHGKGRTFYRNDAVYTGKVWRGSVLQTVLQSMRVGVAPIINALVYYIDDCPQPMWSVSKSPIKEEFNLTDTDFYKKVWWPDLMAMARRFSLRMTFVLIFSYDDAVADKGDPQARDGKGKGFSAEPFYAAAAKGVPLWMAREAIRLGHEVGLHGYNHQSLIKGGRSDGTTAGWMRREPMIKALKLARREWQNIFGPGHAPFTYIAPNNYIHRAGKEAVREAFPEIRVMSAQYLNEDDIEGQEFDVDPDVAHFMDLPRVSSEFFTGAHNNVPMLDGVMLVGAWTHFVHPDDVYDDERNGPTRSWKGLKASSIKMLKHMRKSYPWMRSLTARDAHGELVGFRSGNFSYEYDDKQIRVNLGDRSKRASQFVIHTDPGVKVTGVDRGRLIGSYPDLGYYYVEGRGPITTVHLSE